ncbi:MAG: segregation/condensation protein A [Candidatus Thermoplasmatota archaeon]|nr:segregation/condensation protein A [Candidatus Thermoplasmatota archaeon]
MQQLKIDNDVINHLLFHKSLIDENEDATRINHYVNMLQKADEGEHVSIENPFDRSIAIVFELVMQQQLNPWDIDLISFSTMYLKRAKQEKIDLIIAGRIIYMAWKILKLQSDNLIGSLETEEERYEPFGWGDVPTEMWLTQDTEYSYTNLVMNMPKPPIEEPVRRNAKRKVTLIELIGAFDLARKESEEYQFLEGQRAEERARLVENARRRMKGTSHEDHLEKDVEAVWQKIKSFPQKTMTLVDLCERKGKDEVIRILLSILFLSNDNKIVVRQKKFPYGKIYIKTVGCS